MLNKAQIRAEDTTYLGTMQYGDIAFGTTFPGGFFFVVITPEGRELFPHYCLRTFPGIVT